MAGQSPLQTLEQEIRAVEREIKQAETNAKQAISDKDRDYWRQKESQLRQEESQLRQEESQLRQEKLQSQGQGSQPSSSQRTRDAELEELWKDLAACKEENGFISLPKKLEKLFPLVKGKLMVRDCYSKLVHIVEERAEVQLLSSTQTGDSEMTDVSSSSAGPSVEKGYVDRSMMVIGTPGIGKSMWLIYLLFLLAKADRCVVLDKVQNKDEQNNEKYLFSKSGCFRSSDLNTFFKELGKRSTFLLNDSKVPATKVAMTILVSSPAKKIVYEKIAKKFYMPLWTWEELVKLWKECYSQRSADDVVFLYMHWGGVVCWVLEHANEPENLDNIDTAVESMNTEELKKACRGDSDDRVGSRLVHIIPTDDFKRILETRLATPYISDKVYQKLTRNTVDDVCGFLASTKGDHACSAMRGQLFERFVMFRQSEGQGRTWISTGSPHASCSVDNGGSVDCQT